MSETRLKAIELQAGSTDFEVHRNWLAITHSLPPSQWYFEKTSDWTLDYPPFFAWFEYALSSIASLVFGSRSPMLQIENLDYAGWDVVWFQRSTVIVTELLLFVALKVYVSATVAMPQNKTRAHTIALSILLSPALLIIDHIHFQYNGFLSALFVLSLVLARRQSTLLLSGFTFAVLLCFKHIYLYVALAYFVYLGRAYCLDPKSRALIPPVRVKNIIKLGATVLGVFAIAFGPFVYWGEMMQVKERLFPFARGLCHVYWAPNVWALYTFLDKTLIHGFEVDAGALNSGTRGLVGDTAFAVLPTILPQHTFFLTLFFQVVPLVKLWLTPTWETFLGGTTLCAYASFLFGWHVHEKAILHIILPMSFIALRDRRYLAAFHPLAVAGHLGLFPLLYQAQETPIKFLYTMCWLATFLLAFGRLAAPP
ncbi:glycosyl transferase, partial [Ascosphaera pollenicola]